MMDGAMIQAMPKSDLHAHLDGSMRVATLIELAREQGVALPSCEEAGLRELVFKPTYANLGEYLRGFAYTCAALQTFDAMERVAFEMAEDAIATGVRYLEIRFAPQRLAASNEACVRAFKAVGDGLARARRLHNHSAAVRAGEDIPFEGAIICCAMRNLARGMGAYYDQLLDFLTGMRPKEAAQIASQEAVRAAVSARERHGVPVMGFDLAGEESGHPAGRHHAAFEEAHRCFLRKTVHAGEAYGPESIYEAIARCHAERIGHGAFLFAPDKIQDPQIVDRVGFVEQLADYIATMRITLEVCPTSNLQTIPELGGDMRRHPVARMLASGMSVAISTDNTLVSHTDINRELALVAEACDLDLAGFKRLTLAGFKGAFFPGRYAEKRLFVSRVAERIEAVAARACAGLPAEARQTGARMTGGSRGAIKEDGPCGS